MSEPWGKAKKFNNINYNNTVEKNNMDGDDYIIENASVSGNCNNHLVISNIEHLPSRITSILKNIMKDNLNFKIKNRHIEFRKEDRLIAEGEIESDSPLSTTIKIKTFKLNMMKLEDVIDSNYLKSIVLDINKKSEKTKEDLTILEVYKVLKKCNDRPVEYLKTSVNNLYKFSKYADDYSKWKNWLNKKENFNTYLYIKNLDDLGIRKEYFQLLYSIIKGNSYNECIIKKNVINEYSI